MPQHLSIRAKGCYEELPPLHNTVSVLEEQNMLFGKEKRLSSNSVHITAVQEALTNISPLPFEYVFIHSLDIRKGRERGTEAREIWIYIVGEMTIDVAFTTQPSFQLHIL